jgi:hypothetical protein
MVAGLGDHGAPVGVPDQNDLILVLIENTVRDGNVVSQRLRGILDDADPMASIPKDAIDRLPA